MKDNNKAFGLFNGFLGLALSLGIFFTFSMILCAGLLNLLGFKYTSISALLWFLFTYIIMAFIIEPIVEAYVLAVTELGRFNSIISNILGFIFCVGTDIILISFIESIINGIWIPDRTIIFYSMITYVCGKVFEALTFKNSDLEGTESEKHILVKEKVAKKDRKAKEQREESSEEK